MSKEQLLQEFAAAYEQLIGTATAAAQRGATIPTTRDAPPQRVFDRALSRERHRVERCINRLKQSRRGATRYETLAVTYLAMVTIAATLI